MSKAAFGIKKQKAKGGQNHPFPKAKHQAVRQVRQICSQSKGLLWDLNVSGDPRGRFDGRIICWNISKHKLQQEKW